jgi:hypothetical protein
VRVADWIEIDRIAGRWVLTFESHEDYLGNPVDVSISVSDLLTEIRRVAPELLNGDP